MRRTTRQYRLVAAPGDSRLTLLPARLMGTAEGWAMVRRPNGMPFCIEEHIWDAAPIAGEKIR